MPRVGVAWDPTGAGVWSVRASYGLFYDQFQNGAGTSSQVAISATPWAQFDQFSGAGLNFQNPYQGRPSPGPETFVRPSTVFALDPEAKPPVAQNWNLSVQRSLFDQLPRRSSATSARPGGISRATSRPTRPSSGPARRRRTPTAGASTPTARPTAAACDLSTVAMLRSVTRSSYHAGQASISRRFRDAVGVQRVVLVLEVARPPVGDEPVGRRREAARGRERSGAEPVRPRRRIGPVALRCPSPLRGERQLGAAALNGAPAALRAVLGGWQFNAIAAHNSGTPFTVSDSANVALQANSPPISGFPASRPNLVGDPNAGPHTVERVDQPLRVPAAERPDAGRAVRQRRPQHRARTRLHQRRPRAGARLHVCRSATRLQFRAEAFNVTNHVNFGLPVADLNSPNFGRIFSCRPAAADPVRGEVDLSDASSVRRRPARGTRAGGWPWRPASACSSASPRCSSTRSGVFLKPLAEEFGWSREAVSAAFGIAAMTVAVCSPAARLPARSDRPAPRDRPLPDDLRLRVRVAVAARRRACGISIWSSLSWASSATARRRWRTRAPSRAGSTGDAAPRWHS